MESDFLDFARQYITENRWNRFNEVIANRTRHLTVVLENIYQSQNASAVLRSCDCFGIQDVHIIENNNKYNINPDVELGSSKWLSLHRYNEKEHNTEDCLNSLRERGYKIIATSPHRQNKLLPDLEVDEKSALLFGTELTGLSDKALEMADEYVKIPMYGFTESFNISVSAATVLYDLSSKLRKNDVVTWKLPEQEKNEILAHWIQKSVKNGEKIKRKYRELKKQG